MTKVQRSRFVYFTATTLNGYLADKRHSVDWLFNTHSESAPDFESFIENVGAVVMGSNTYQWLLTQEQVLKHPSKWAAFYGERSGFVFTRRGLSTPEGQNVTILTGAVVEHVQNIIDAANGKDIWIVGGGDLAAQFLAVGALDELQLTFAPAMLESGKELFPATVPAHRLRLTNVQQFDQLVHLTYIVNGTDEQ